MSQEELQLPPSDFAPLAIPRNDGRGVHHRLCLEWDLARAQAMLDELKVLAGLEDPPPDQLGGS